MILKKFDMYLYHQRERNDQLNKSWLRTMFYFLSQQIVWQNIEYWTLYACLRSNKNIQLISYSYYVKFVTSDDSTFFRHIDMSISKYLVDDHEKNIIQRSLSLDDESFERCIEIVSDFHKHIERWWAKVKTHEMMISDHIHDLNKIWLKEDVVEYDDFVLVFCQRSEVRVTRSEILHESTHNNDDIKRRIILSWFVAVSQIDQTLNNEKFDKWENIARAHATQKVINLTLSDLINRFELILYRFSASTQLYLDSLISQALICRIIWDDSVVQAQTNVMLRVNRERADRAINRHRFEALRAFRRVYNIIKTIEKLFYEADSFFNR